MYRFHLKQNLRSLFFLLMVSVVLGACGILWWANHTGLPDSWRTLIEREISKQGAHIDIGSLSYLPLRGVIASDVRVYSDPQHTSELSRLERIVLDFDKIKLARGIFHLTKVELQDAGLSMPVNPDDPESEMLEVAHAEGTIFMPGNRRFEVRNARGKIAGINVKFDAKLIGYQHEGPHEPDDSKDGRRRAMIAKIINQLKRWDYEAETPPSLDIFLEGNANDRSSIIARATLHASRIERNGHVLDNVTAEAEMLGDLLTITSLQASDPSGDFNAHVDYDVVTREGRFDLASSLEIPKLLEAWLGIPAMKGVQVAGRQTLEAEGEFEVDENNVPSLRTTGHIHCESVVLRGMPFDEVETAFSFQNNEWFFRDARLIRTDGEAQGKAMIQWPHVRLALTSTLPSDVYKPFFVGQPLEKILNDFTAREDAAVNVSLEGGFDATDRHSWAYAGGGYLRNLNYKGVPVNHADCRFSLSHHELDFFDGTVTFNYDAYALRDAFNGPQQATAKVGRIRYDAPNKIVEVEAVSGAFWAAPMCRLFAPKVADTLEAYRFHRPPELKASGTVDVTPQGRTALNITFSSVNPADYVFLGENLTLEKPRGKVSIRGERVSIQDLEFSTFSGPVAGKFNYQGKGLLEGEMSWTKLSMAALASTYDLQIKGGGEITGRIEFGLTDGKVETMTGRGLVGMEKAELFSVPMFGPLTPLVGGVLNDKRAGFERAKSAFCTFSIQQGILSTKDFHTQTTSLNFAGNGSVDLKQHTLDMTLRLNARGLLGLITRPLRPFTGLFQFHGTGPLKDTQWENVKFTDPPEDQNRLLLSPPRARIIAE